MFPYLGDLESRLDLCRRAAFIEQRELRSADGRRIAMFTAGDPRAPAVIVINPLGASCLFLVNLIAALTPQRRVVSWETRCLPDRYFDDPVSEQDYEPAAHLADLVAVASAANVEASANILAYCSGSYTALYAAIQGAHKPARMALISPPVEVDDACRRTLYQDTIPPLLARIARGGPRTAAAVRGILLQGVQVSPSDPHYELHLVNNLPFATDEATHRYARLHNAWRTVPWSTLLSTLAVPTAIFHGDRDELVHADAAVALSRALPNGVLHLYEEQGHFAVSTCADLVSDVTRFLLAESSAI